MRVITINSELRQINAQNINPNELNIFADSFVKGTSIRQMIDGNNHCIFVSRDVTNYDTITGFYFIDRFLQQPIFGNAVIGQFNGEYVNCDLDISKIEQHVVFLTAAQADCAFNYYHYL